MQQPKKMIRFWMMWYYLSTKNVQDIHTFYNILFGKMAYLQYIIAHRIIAV